MPTVHADTMLSACASQARPLDHVFFSNFCAATWIDGAS